MLIIFYDSDGIIYIRSLFHKTIKEIIIWTLWNVCWQELVVLNTERKATGHFWPAHKCIAVSKFLAFKSVLGLNHCPYSCDFVPKTKNKTQGKAIRYYFGLKFAPLIFNCILKYILTTNFSKLTCNW